MSNYYLPLSADESFFPQTNEAKLESNIEIIKLVKELESEGKQATPRQQAQIARYVGWGGLANQVFDEYNDNFKAEREELKSLLSRDEYLSLKESSLTAYYTNPLIARAMWKQVVKEGITKGNILDPSMGTGIFFMTMPQELRDKVNLFGIELDKITGLIAKQLFPDAQIIIKGFEKVDFENNDFDLVITNVPFGQTRILDKYGNKSYYIHDYFLKKSLSLVRPYGLVAIISSTGLMDKHSNNIMEEIKNTTNFLGGVRLPNSAFKKIAGTKTTSDILFFQRDEFHKAGNPLGGIINEGVINYPKDERIWISKYFWNFSSQILGKIEIANFHGGTLQIENDGNFIPQLYTALQNVVIAQKVTDVWGKEVKIKTNKIDDNNLPKAIRNLPRYEFGTDANDVFYHTIERGQDKIIKNLHTKTLELYVDDNDVVKYFASSDSRIREYKKYANEDEKNIFDVFCNDKPATTGKYKGLRKKTILFYVPYNKTEKARIIGLTKIKQDYQKIIDIQLNDKMKNFSQALECLNKDYDAFVKKFGHINDLNNSRIYNTDNRYPLIASLEDKKIDDKTGKQIYAKSEAFRTPLVSPVKRIANVSSAKDALLTSVSENRGVDFAFMCSIYPNHTEEDIKKELGDEIVIDPKKYLTDKTVEYITKMQFLSGDVVEKKDWVEKLISINDQFCDWKHYLRLLNNVIPEPIAISDISFRLASSWIPDKVVTNFIYDNFYDGDTDYYKKKDNIIFTSPLGRTIDNASYNVMYWNKKNKQYKVMRDGTTLNNYSCALDIIGYLLNAKQPTVKMIVGRKANDKPIYDTDSVSTETLRNLEKQLESLFKNYILSNAETAKIVEDTYNNLYNRYVNRKYDGSHIFINGLARNYELRDYQKNAVERIIEDKRALLAHEVGTGKTLTMISAAFKLKDLGIINRPLFVVPTNLVSQFGQDILKFYPTRNVLVTNEVDFKKQNRRRFLARIITGDYDGIVIGHSQFEKIEVSPETQAHFITQKLVELNETLDDAEDTDHYTVKELQRIEKGYKDKLERLKFEHQDDHLTFEELGIDFMFVDEAHNYKNVKPVSRLGQIKGINSTTSKRAIDMQTKIKYLHNQYDDSHVVFATGTPVSNSISELWTMMNYIQPDILSKFHIANFDRWVGSFGLVQNVLELNTTGDKYKERKRFIKFVNLPELMTIYRITADIQMASQLNLKLPKAKRFVISSDLTNAQKKKLAELISRTDAIESGEVDPSDDNMLKITGEARKLTLDMRLFGDEYLANDSIKLSQVADNVYRIYERTTNNKSTQMIFSDLGTPTKSNQFDVYHELKKMLIARGIPKEEIEFMHVAKSTDAKIELERKVNSGEVRVLIGSTQKGGTGLNVQHRMKAVHHLDVPWRPSDIIQRNGRIVRQGNIYREVEIYHYITKGSFDNYLWQIQENKLKYITQVMTAKSAIRAMKDIDSETLTASDFKAIATRNPYLKLKMKVDNQLASLLNQKHAFERNYRSSVKNVEEAKKEIIDLSDKLAKLKVDKKSVQGKALETTDFEFATAPTCYNSKTNVNARLRAEITKVAYFSDQTKVGYKTIAKFNGFEIKASYNLRFALLSANGYTNTGTNIFICGKGFYSLQINLTLLKHTDLALQIRNRIANLHKKYDSTESHLEMAKRTVEIGAGSSEFSKSKQVEYLLAKKKMLDPLIAEGTAVVEITEKVNNFNKTWQSKYPGLLQEDQKQNNATDVKYHNDPSNYDDSLFSEDTPNEKEVNKPAKTKKINKKPAKKTHKVQREQKVEVISLFDFLPKKESVKEDSDKEDMKCKQLSLF